LSREADEIDELVESECLHNVCRAEDRQQSCMIRSGEVLREYWEEDGKLCWAVYPCASGGESHRVTGFDIEYGFARGQELWKEYLETLEAGRYVRGDSEEVRRQKAGLRVTTSFD
jgi:hypothetical protein